MLPADGRLTLANEGLLRNFNQQRLNPSLMQAPRLYPLLFLCFAFLATATLSAQVKGLSYTVAPALNYTFFDNESGIDDGLMYGGRLGLGFGEFVELRALYMRDLSSQTLFDDLGLDNRDVTIFNDRDVDLVQYGGEMKLNLGRGNLLPFLTVGTGIQSIEIDGNDASDQIYASGGLGVVFSLADRFTFTLEGKNTAYNDSPFRTLTTVDDRDNAGIDLEDFSPGRLNNLSVGLGLQVYLGGRRPGQLSEIDQAYANAFNKGFRGLSFLVEPTVSRINFDDALPYRDAYFGGVAAGLDFGPLVGLRAYYLRAMDDDEFSFDFDDLSVYGADFRFRLTDRQTSFSPFLTLGGGYIDANSDYVGRSDDAGISTVSQAFATGGGGIALNITRNFSLTGAYKALLTTGADVEDINSTEQIRTSNQWSVGVNLAFGNKTRTPDAVFTYEAERSVQAQRAKDQAEMSAALAEQARENKKATNQLKADYELRLLELREELAMAETKTVRDDDKIDSLRSELSETEDVVEELEDREVEFDQAIAQAVQDSLSATQSATVLAAEPTPAPTPAPASAPLLAGQNVSGRGNTGTEGRIVLTPAEFEGLIEEIFEGLNAGLPPLPAGDVDAYYFEQDGMPMAPPAPRDTARINQMERELADLRSAVNELKEQQNRVEAAQAADKAELRAEMRESTSAILKEIRDMRAELAEKSTMTEKEKRKMEKRKEKEDKE